MLEQYVYEYEHDDIYCYPNTNVLRNKLAITNWMHFHVAEKQITSLRTAQLLLNPPEGKLTYSYLQKLHRYLFSDIYEWAGQTRKVNISKGNHFCDALYIDDQMNLLMHQLEKESYLSGLDKKQLAERMAYYIGEINAIHPFREGNGRTQRLFITILAYRNGYKLNMQGISAEQMYEASVKTFHGDYTMMARLFFENME